MTHAEETIYAAAHPEHEWDRRALDWPGLTTDAIVVEVGGYTGRWALQIADRYAPRLYVFEPQPWAADVCREVLGDRATVLNYGLGVASAYLSMGEWGTDGCSFVKEGTIGAWIHEAGAAFRDLGIDHVDLMLMNIEGYEYVLLPHLMAHGLLPRRLIVQWHPQPDQFDEQARLIAAIERSMRPLWSYGNVLMAWEVGR